MITEGFAKKQLERLSGLDQFPKQPAAVRELILALMVSEIDSVAIRVIDYILGHTTSSNPRCPLPADLRRLAYEGNEVLETERRECPAEAPRYHCALCGDTGVRESVPSFRLGNFTSIASWCMCERGKVHPWPPGSQNLSSYWKSPRPDWVQLVNQERAKLRKLNINPTIFGKRSATSAKLGRLDDPLDYHGEF